MKTTYKGFEIEVKKDEDCTGAKGIAFNIIRLSDKWILDDSFEYDKGKLKDKLESLKSTVDDYLENPIDFEDSFK